MKSKNNTDNTAGSDCQERLVRLSCPTARTMDRRIKQLGLKVGDTIRLIESDWDWLEHRLTLIWHRGNVAVWELQFRNIDSDSEWFDCGENARFDLKGRNDQLFLETNAKSAGTDASEKTL